jgi:omega-6 fatty acid desaturase (delta-12 desaturase)
MTQAPHDSAAAAGTQPGLRALVARFETPTLRESGFQLLTSAGLFVAVCATMHWTYQFSYLLTLLLGFPAAGLLVRTFIVQHDCGHGSFFRSRRLNDITGILCGVITFTPYASWRRQHNCHHGNWNNLDRRESGADIYSSCITVDEYRTLSPWRRFFYRLTRHPVVTQILLPPLVFMFLYRIPFDTPKSWIRERNSVYWTNLALLLALGGLALLVGVKEALLVQLPILALAAMMGILLFALQHRFEGVVWSRQAEWGVIEAALEGSSYFKLPRVLQWFTGNIGFHHVHHLSARVPNYRLEACHKAIPALQAATTLTWRDAYKAIRMALWDEPNHRMIPFADLKYAAAPLSRAA